MSDDGTTAPVAEPVEEPVDADPNRLEDPTPPPCTCGGWVHRAVPDPVIGGNTGEPRGIVSAMGGTMRTTGSGERIRLRPLGDNIEADREYRDRLRAMDDALRITAGNEEFGAHDVVILAHYALTGEQLPYPASPTPPTADSW